MGTCLCDLLFCELLTPKDCRVAPLPTARPAALLIWLLIILISVEDCYVGIGQQVHTPFYVPWTYQIITCNMSIITNLTVSQSVDYTFSSHLGLIRCLTLIVRVSTQHDIHTFTEKLGNTHKIILPEKLTLVSSPPGCFCTFTFSDVQ